MIVVRKLAGLTLTVLTVILVSTAPALADTHNVPSPYATIQAAIDAASAGDTVLVSAGTYHENVRMKPNIWLKGAVGVGAIIHGDWWNPALQFSASENATITGFTITNGRPGISVANWPSNVTIKSCLIEGNLHPRIEDPLDPGGGGGIQTSSKATITNNTIRHNTGSAGAGIMCLPYTSSDCSDTKGFVTIQNNIIEENTATIVGGGVEMCVNGTISANTIRANHSDDKGGGIDIEYANPLIFNNVIRDNTAYWGGAMSCQVSWAKIYNNTMVNNHGDGCGGIFAHSGGTPLIFNCVLWNNGSIDLSACAARYSDVQQGTGGELTNISVVPLFQNPATGDYRLRPRSPCIDKGTNTGAPADDFAGTSRPRDGNGDGVAVTDMGAYEVAMYSGPTTIYVDPAGNDLTGLGTAVSPFRGITKGISVALAGDTVQAGAGSYGTGASNETFPIAIKNGVDVQGAGCSETDSSHLSTIVGDNANSVFYVHWTSQPTKLDGFSIGGGRAETGGGIFVEIATQMTISNNRIVGNSVYRGSRWGSAGAGIYCGSMSEATICGNLIRSNTADQGNGGGIALEWQSQTKVFNNVIIWNHATGYDLDYAWIGHGGGIWMADDASATITNNTIAQNDASNPQGPDGPGGGLYLFGSHTNANLSNSIIWGNTDDISCNDNKAFPTYCDISDGDCAGTYGNISTGPAFVAVEGIDFRLSPRSACIDAGTNDGAPSIDRDGAIRPIDGNGDLVPVTDMGAYEAAAYAGPVTIRVWLGGSDADGNGSDIMPYRSITKAMSCALYGDTVLAGPKPPMAMDIYQTGTGERFPIVLGSGVKLQGMGASASRIQGDGVHSVIYVPTAASSDTLLDGFNITGGGGGSGGGGGIQCNATGNFTISDNVISGNSAAEGGGIYVWGAAPTITRNTISGNTAELGGGIWCVGSAFISNNVIHHNTATSEGGGVYNFISSWPTLTNNTIAENTAPTGGGGGIASLAPNAPAIDKSILWGNTGGDLSNCSATYSDISDGSGGVASNISQDPSFVATSTGDYHIAADSPCLDKAVFSGTPAVDKDEVIRPQNGLNFGAPRVDMGAYERPYMAINDGQDVTTSTTVAVHSNFTGATQMRIDNGTGWAGWQAYGASKDITIPGGNGDKTVRAEYAYGGGRSMVLSDVITLDTGASHAPAKRTTSIAATATPTAVSYNGTTQMTSSLTSSGTVVPNRVGVALWGRPVAGGSWTQLAVASYDTTAASYEAGTGLTCNMLLQMRFGGDSRYMQSFSTTLTVRSQARLYQPWLSPSSPRHMSYFSVYGYVKPRHAGSTKLYFYRYTRLRRWVGHWHYYWAWRSFTARYARHFDYGSYSRYRLVYRLAYAGRYYVRPYHADTSHSGTWGSARIFTVR